jgi:hypothetical protein
VSLPPDSLGVLKSKVQKGWLLALALVVVLALVGGTWGLLEGGASIPEAGALRPNSGAEVASSRAERGAPVESGLPTTGLERREVASTTSESQESGGSVAIDFHVVVAAYGRRDRKRYADVECEFGVGVGSARDGAPLLTEMSVLAQGKSDASGELRVRLDVPGSLLRDQDFLLVFGRIVTPGFQDHTQPLSISTPIGTDVIEMTLEAARGGTLRGVVLGPEGKPARAKIERVGPGMRSSRTYERVDTNPEGRFEVRFSEPGTYRLLARETDVGTAVSTPITVRIDESPDELRLQLEGGGVLAGVVVDGMGKPVEELELTLEWGGGTRPEPSEPPWSSESLELELEGGGFTAAHVTTDATGRFRSAGLRQGVWDVRAKEGRRLSRERLLTPTPVPSGSEELRLVLDGSVLVVRIAGLDDVRGKVGVDMVVGSRSSKTGLFCRECDEDGNVLDSGADWSVKSWKSRSGEVIFDTRPGASYVVTMVPRKTPRQEVVVRIPDDRAETVHEFQLPEPLEAGHLRVQIQAPNGTPFTFGNRLEVRSPSSGMLLLKSRMNSREPDYDLELPPGTYGIMVDDRVGYSHHGIPLLADRYGAVFAEVMLGAGQTLELPLRLGVGCELEVKFTHAHAPDFEAWPLGEMDVEVEPVREAFTSAPDLILMFRPVVLWLEPAVGGGCVDLELGQVGFRPSLSADEAETGFGAWLSTIARVAPGAYILHARIEGFAPAAVPIEIKPGVTNQVEVAL